MNGSLDATANHVQIAVVGPGDTDPALDAIAEAVGALLAGEGAVVVTGGLDGVMAAAARGAQAAGGTTVGLLPGNSRLAANRWLDVVIPTGLGEARDALVVAAADGVIAVGGSWGTLAEIALARRTGRPVVTLSGWAVLDAAGAPITDGVQPAETPADAVRLVLTAVRDTDRA